MARRRGWTRLGRKRFRYVDSRGREIADDDQLERIRSFAIPPAWTDVWISPNPGGELVNLTAPLLNAYISENLGNGFTAKDFRTWGGTLLAAVELAKHGPATDEAESKRVLAVVMRKVGKELGNTAAVARASYVSPTVVDHYLAGGTIEDFRPRKGSRPAWLTMDERALLRRLRSKEG